MSDKKRVYIANTGGTIGMQRTEHGYAPVPDFLAQQMAAMPELHHETMPEYTLNDYAPLLDSANMTPHEWHLIAQDIATHYDDYDGFVVIHGTDTMAYTASALPFLLRGLNKPVIVTGSQIPLSELRNDARRNLITSMLIAANYAIPEVCICFGGKLLRGCRTQKVDADSLEAFDSPNFAPLARIGIDVDVRWDLVLARHDLARQQRRGSHNGDGVQVAPMRQAVVAVLRLFPGITPELIRNMLQPPLEGLVLQGYGVGNGPDNNPAILQTLQEATARGVVIVDTTQCHRGRVDLANYAAGSALMRAGVISGYDMTTEAALAKMIYLLSQDLSVEQVRTLMQDDLHGELTRFENVMPLYAPRARSWLD